MIFFTACNDSYFQQYIPLWAYCIKKAYPDSRVFVRIYGHPSRSVTDAIGRLNTIWDPWLHCNIREWPGIVGPSTFNMLRFLDCPTKAEIDNFEDMMITDVDLFIFRQSPTHYQHHNIMAASVGGKYFTYHGPWKRPKRFEGGWTGDRERLAGGLVYVTPQWVEETENIRMKLKEQLEAGQLGGYREDDEVVLCRIVKECGMRLTQNKNLPNQYRGIHLGDFKDTMKTRYESNQALLKRIAGTSLHAWQNMYEGDTVFNDMRLVACKVPEIYVQVERLNAYIKRRV